MSAFIGGTVHVCGGKEEGGDVVELCYKYNNLQNRWEFAFPLVEAREYSAALTYASPGSEVANKWWITGGTDKKGGEEFLKVRISSA